MQRTVEGIKQLAENVAMTCRVGIAAMPTSGPCRPSARRSGSLSTRCRCRSSGPPTPSRRSPTSPGRPPPSGSPPGSCSWARALRRCSPCPPCPSRRCPAGGRARHHGAAAGDGGFARRPVRQARSGRTPRPSTSSAPSPPATGSSTTVTSTSSPRRVARASDPLADAPTRVPIYVASLGPPTSASPAACRRVHRRFVFRRLRTCSLARSVRAPAGPAAHLPSLDLTVSVGVEFTDDVDAAGRRHAEGYAFTFGAMGSAHHQLLQRSLYPAGLRRRRQGRPAAVARRRPGGRAARRAHCHRIRHQPDRLRRPDPRSAPSLPGRRHHHAPRSAPWRPHHDLDRQLDDLATSSTSSTTSTRKPPPPPRDETSP